MTDVAIRTTPTGSFWIISVLGLLWNLIGAMTYLMTVTLSEEALAAMSEAERALHTSVPVWVTAAYAIAVWGGTLGCLGLLVRKAWAVPVLTVSLAAIVVQMGHALLMSELIAVQGAGAAVLPVLIVVIAVYLVSFAKSARGKDWIG